MVVSSSFRLGVVPFTGTWIETRAFQTPLPELERRPLHGDVD